MNFKITITPDEAYYKEVYQESISTKWYLKLFPFINIIFLTLGIVSFFFIPFRDNTAGFVLVLFGGYLTFLDYYRKRKWLKDRLESKSLNKNMSLEFSPEIINISGPFSNGTVQWEGLHSIKKTKKGILLSPQKGSIIYLPDNVFDDQSQIGFILIQEERILKN